jgi:hypothetical protein
VNLETGGETTDLKYTAHFGTGTADCEVRVENGGSKMEEDDTAID